MRIFSIVITLFIFSLQSAVAGEPVIKTVEDNSAGTKLRIVPTTAGGWAVFSLTEFKLYSFDSCGVLLWSKAYAVPVSSWNSNDFLRTLNGGFAFMTRVIYGGVDATLVVKLDGQGNIVWSKVMDDPQYNHFPYTLSEDAQGNLFFFGNVSHISNNPVNNIICKLSQAGNVLWTKHYDHGGIWGGAIQTSDNGTLARTGSTFIKTDNAGNVQWTSQLFSSLTYNYFAPQEVSDGYIFTTYTNGSNFINFHKMDKSGALVGGNYFRTDFTGQPPLMRMRNNGNIACLFGNTVLEFDKDLNVISQNAFGTGGVTFNATDICFLPDNIPVTTGTVGNALFVSRMDAQYHSTCDVASPPVNISNIAATQSFTATNVLPYSLNVVDFNLTVSVLQFLQNTLCRPIKTLSLGPDKMLCKGASVTLNNQTPDSFNSYLWSTGAVTPSISISQPGTYWLQVSYNCEADILRDTIRVIEQPSVAFSLGNDVEACDSVRKLLRAPVCVGCVFTWSDGSNADSLEVTAAGSYWLSVIDSVGCTYGDTVNVEVLKCDCYVYVPSAFTPNGDGLNEIFNPVYDCDMQDYRLRVFDRWGQEIFASKDLSVGWDGRFNNVSMPIGVYVYRLEYSPIVRGRVESKVIKHGRVVVLH